MLWALSGILDNIATAMLGGAIIKNRYSSVIQHCRTHPDPRKRKLPGWLFMLLVAVIAASNLGGGASAFGDTTTTMIWISGVSILTIAMGYPASLLGQFSLMKLSVGKHRELPEDYDHTHEGRQEYIDWTWGDLFRGLLSAVTMVLFPWRWGRLVQNVIDGRKLLHMLGIPGMAVGNIFFDQPGLGLWIGMLGGYSVGWLLDRLQNSEPAAFGWVSMLKAVPNTVFLLLLVYSAKLIPLKLVTDTIFGAFHYFEVAVDYDIVAIVLGLLSSIFDNIPLTSIAIDIQNFRWAFLALAVGFGGSMLWFGSSAGVALAKEYPELENTRDWFPRPFLVIFVAYWIILVTHLMIWRWLPLLF
jgi:Na+/H+ antiporter NhaD/arsenite permease-like protein